MGSTSGWRDQGAASAVHVRQPRMLCRTFWRRKDLVGAFTGPHHVALGEQRGQGAFDLADQLGVEIFPEARRFDVGVQTGKRRRHRSYPSTLCDKQTGPE